MKSKIISSIFVVSIVAVFFWWQQQDDVIDLINQELGSAPSSYGKPVFNLLDATSFSEIMYPWLGFPVTIIHEQELLGKGDHASLPPEEFKIKQFLAQYKGKKRIIFDIPSWNITMDKKDQEINEKHIQWILKVFQCVDEVIPEADVGFFGLPYSPWGALKSNKSLESYQRVHNQLKPVFEASDTLYPYFQVFSGNDKELSYLMGAQLYIAKTSGKPVYPIISHKNIVSRFSQNKLLPVDKIKQQCEFIRNNADGMVWWSTENEQWDNSWYDEVANFCFL